MRYAAFDGELFKTAEECLEYEARLQARDTLKERVEKYLSMREYKSDGARRRALTIIMSWIDYDIKDNPGRYVQSKEESTARVQAVT